MWSSKACMALSLIMILWLRAIFNWVSKVIRDCIGFALLHSVIGLENLRHPLNQTDAKVKPIATWSLAFSRTWDQLPVFTLSSHWLPLKLSFCSDWPLWLLWFWFYDTQSKSVLNTSYLSLLRLLKVLFRLGWMLLRLTGNKWQFDGTHLFSWVEKGTVRVKCFAPEHHTTTRPGLEPGPFNPESSALTFRPPHLPHVKVQSFQRFDEHCMVE